MTFAPGVFYAALVDCGFWFRICPQMYDQREVSRKGAMPARVSIVGIGLSPIWLWP
jgi:hypothetical protein